MYIRDRVAAKESIAAARLPSLAPFSAMMRSGEWRKYTLTTLLLPHYPDAIYNNALTMTHGGSLQAICDEKCSRTTRTLESMCLCNRIVTGQWFGKGGAKTLRGKAALLAMLPFLDGRREGTGELRRLFLLASRLLLSCLRRVVLRVRELVEIAHKHLVPNGRSGREIWRGRRQFDENPLGENHRRLT